MTCLLSSGVAVHSDYGFGVRADRLKCMGLSSAFALVAGGHVLLLFTHRDTTFETPEARVQPGKAGKPRERSVKLHAQRFRHPGTARGRRDPGTRTRGELGGRATRSRGRRAAGGGGGDDAEGGRCERSDRGARPVRSIPAAAGAKGRRPVRRYRGRPAARGAANRSGRAASCASSPERAAARIARTARAVRGGRHMAHRTRRAVRRCERPAGRSARALVRAYSIRSRV